MPLAQPTPYVTGTVWRLGCNETDTPTPHPADSIILHDDSKGSEQDEDSDADMNEPLNLRRERVQAIIAKRKREEAEKTESEAARSAKRSKGNHPLDIAAKKLDGRWRELSAELRQGWLRCVQGRFCGGPSECAVRFDSDGTPWMTTRCMTGVQARPKDPISLHRSNLHLEPEKERKVDIDGKKVKLRYLNKGQIMPCIMICGLPGTRLLRILPLKADAVMEHTYYTDPDW